MAKDYYSTLGVDKKVNKDDLKKAFYKLAAKHHPSKGGDEAKFKEVNEAYQVLSDEKKRKEYDMYGQTFNGAGSKMLEDNKFLRVVLEVLIQMIFKIWSLIWGIWRYFGEMFGGFGGFNTPREASWP